MLDSYILQKGFFSEQFFNIKILSEVYLLSQLLQSQRQEDQQVQGLPGQFSKTLSQNK